MFSSLLIIFHLVMQSKFGTWCLFQDEDYQMLLHLFIGSMLPYIEGLDSWLFEGTLDDPYEEVIVMSQQFAAVYLGTTPSRGIKDLGCQLRL